MNSVLFTNYFHCLKSGIVIDILDGNKIKPIIYSSCFHYIGRCRYKVYIQYI